MRLFVDTNVLIDVLANRKDFYADSSAIWTLAESGRTEAAIAMISISNCYYVIRKHAGRKNADQAIRLLRDTFQAVDLTSQILNQAIDADFTDFEDALQYFSATHARADYFITRNPNHFPQGTLPIMTPREFLAAFPSES